MPFVRKHEEKHKKIPRFDLNIVIKHININKNVKINKNRDALNQPPSSFLSSCNSLSLLAKEKSNLEILEDFEIVTLFHRDLCI